MMDARQLKIVDTAVDLFYKDWEETTQQQKNEKMYEQRCSNDEEDNIRFLGRPDMRIDFKATLERVTSHQKAVKVNQGRPGKIKTETIEGRRASMSPNAAAAAEVTNDFFSASGGRRGSGVMPSNPNRASPVASDSVSPLLGMPPRSQSTQQLKRSSGSFKRSSLSVPTSPTEENAAGAGVTEGVVKRSSGSFRRSSSVAVPLTRNDSKSSLKKVASIRA